MEPIVQEKPPKLRVIYDYLKKNNLVKAETYEVWQTKMQNPKVAEKTYNYLRDNGKVPEKDFNSFQSSVGLSPEKKKTLLSRIKQFLLEVCRRMDLQYWKVV